MDFLKTIGHALGDVVSFVEEKNKKTARLNRIRTVIRCEEKAAEKEYIALGRYFYNNLRDENNAVTENHCVQLDGIEQRLEAALNQLEAFYSEEAEKQDTVREEIDLSDVTELEQPPEELEEKEEELKEEVSPLKEEAVASPDENEDLPFEG